jgi:hypothetical protein
LGMTEWIPDRARIEALAAAAENARRRRLSAKAVRRGGRPYRLFAWAAVLAIPEALMLRWYIPAVALAAMVMLLGYALCYLRGYAEGHEELAEQIDAGLEELAEARQQVMVEERLATALETLLPVQDQGYLYVIGFSSGPVKVGQTADPRRRFAEHRRDAGAYGVKISNFWISIAHSNYLANEVELIDLCLGFGTPVKREYFHGADFDVVARGAADLFETGAMP